MLHQVKTTSLSLGDVYTCLIQSTLNELARAACVTRQHRAYLSLVPRQPRLDAGTEMSAAIDGGAALPTGTL